MVKITGVARVKRKFAKLRGAEIVREVGKALFAAGNMIQVDAQHSITEGSISGRGHIPSKPGEPPNADTHALDRQIETEMVGPLKARVVSADPKSKYLERGTSKMAARPFMWPAAERNRKNVTAMVAQAVSRVTKSA